MAHSPAKAMWLAGGESPNPLGRKLARKTITAAVERFLKKNTNGSQLQALYDLLEAKDKLSLLLMLFPYVIPKAPQEGISNDEVEKLYAMLENNLQRKHG